MDKTYQPEQIESRWYERWEAEGHFAPSGQGEPYSIMIPPPNVTGSLHMGHAFQDTIMDTLIRWRRMQGNNTLWQVGTDHAGIATQMLVERKLAVEEGKSRHDLGRDAFIDKVWEWKHESGGHITRQLRRMGSSVDWSRERFTMDDGFYKAVQEVFVRLYKEGLIYRGKRLVNWDPTLHTAISDLEVENREQQGQFWHFRYPLADGVKTDAGLDHLVVATTRPETLLGDTGVAVNPEDPRYASLIGKFIELPLVGRRIPIVADEHADMEKGSGCVKITPAHDFNDYEVGKRHSLPLINVFSQDAAILSRAEVFDIQGRPLAEIDPSLPQAYAGLDRFEARQRLVADMEAAGLLEKVETVNNTLPYGDRSGDVIEPLLTDQWFVAVESLAKPAIEAVENGDIQFVPKNYENMYFSWMRDLQDWCISRQLWWGHRIPAWYDVDGNVFVARNEMEATRDYLVELADFLEHEQGDLDSAMRLRGFNRLLGSSPELSAEALQTMEKLGVPRLTQDEDVLDTWFSSGLWTFATLGWPDRTPELATFHPSSVLVTGFDIIFFWVARMIMLTLKFTGEVPFKTVYVHGLVRDGQGQKMSKSKGNAVDPMEALQKFGADPLRWYFYTNSAPWLPSRFHEKAVVEGQKKFFSTLWNTYAFFVMYANIVNFDPTQHRLEDCKLTVMDKWLLSRLNTTVKAVDDNLSAYKVPEAARALQDFVDEMSNWYVRRSRPRFWAQAESDDRTAAFMTLYTALVSTAKVAAPMAPFMSEEIYRNLVCSVDKSAPESVHLCLYPAYEESRVDKQLEAEMDEVLQVVTLGRAARNLSNLKNRQPLQALYTDANSGLGQLYTDIIKQELNVKDVQFLTDMSQFTAYTFKPQLKLLGKKLGKRLNDARQALQELDGSAAKKELDATGVLKLSLPDGDIELTAEELLIETAQKEGYTSVSDRGVTVVLDTALTEELIREGFVREIISKLQTMRKEAGFNVTDHIQVYCQGSEKVRQVLEENQEAILHDVLGDACHFDALEGYTAQQDVNGETVTFGVKRV